MNLARITHKLKNFFNYLMLVVITALLIVSVLIALPKTESYFAQFNYDLNLKDDSYQAKSYILELEIKPEDQSNADSKIRATKNILHERLDRYNVEVVKITDYDIPEVVEEEDQEQAVEEEKEEALDAAEETGNEVEINEVEDDSSILGSSGLDELNEDLLRPAIKINIETTRDLEKVDQLIGTRNYIRLMVPKDDVEFDDPDNAIAQFLKENYEDTKFTRRSFRSVVIKELPTSNGDNAFFSIYKPRTLERNDFYDFLDEYAGETIGIRTDDFVSPFNVPIEFSRDYQNAQGTTTQPEFAPAVASTEEDAEVMDVLMNSGVIPIRYQVIEDEEIPVETVKPDYYISIAAVAAAILGVVVFIGWRNKQNRRENMVFFLSVIFTYSLWLSLLKLLQIPIDLDIMYFVGFLLIFFIKIINFRSTSRYVLEMMILITLLFGYLLGEGYIQIFSRQMFFVALSAVIIVTMMRYYTDNMRKFVFK